MGLELVREDLPIPVVRRRSRRCTEWISGHNILAYSTTESTKENSVCRNTKLDRLKVI